MSEAIGAHRARITLQSPARVADEIGGTAIAWVAQGEAWAAIEALGAAQVAAFDTSISTSGYRVTIRARADVRPGWRLAWNARVFRVLGVRDDGGARIDLMCEEELL